MPPVGDLLWRTVLVGVVGVSALLLAVAASRLLRKRLGGQTRSQAFSLEDLRQMRDSGKITQQEYETMRTTVIAEMGADAALPPPQTPGPRLARDREVEGNAEGAASDVPVDDSG